jgi:AIPR protein
MKIEEFKRDLRTSLEKICVEKKWSFDNSKQRGMAFEDWCFNLLRERYPASENNPEECIIRGDDAGVDIFFESKETEEIYIIQCKHPKIAASDPIAEDEIKSFFSNYALLSDKKYLDKRQTTNPKIEELAQEFDYWVKKGFLIHFIFISTGTAGPKIAALVDKFGKDNQTSNVEFEVWDLAALKDEYVNIKSIEEQYPEEWSVTLAQGHFMIPAGELENISFVVPGTVLQQLARDHKDSLFNWNIRRFLGRKGEVNAGLKETLEKEPQHFFYYNNGISGLCESFSFDPKTRKLKVKKLQIVNGAQTVGAIKHADADNLARTLVLVKLTAVKHATRETGLAAALIKTNNTQNTLRVPDFRSNDKIQIWLEQKFKNTKPRGEMLQIVYGRKRPYPRSTSSQTAMKLQDLGKIRYAWHQDPRIPIAEPARLFQLPEENGLYGFAFGSEGEPVDIWSEDQFRQTLLAIHAYNKIQEELQKLQTSNDDLKQITRLRYYGLRLFKQYVDEILPITKDTSFDELCAFGGKFNAFFERAQRIIRLTLSQSYREFLAREKGTAFALPRDAKVWELVKAKFSDNLALMRELEETKT